MKSNGIYLTSILALCAIMIFISNSFGTEWEHKTQCFDAFTVPVMELFFTRHSIVWSEEERGNIPFNRWNVPKITPINNMDGAYEEFLNNLGVEGYIDTSSTLTAKQPWFRGDMTATLGGELIIKNYGMLEQLLDPGETIVVVPVRIENRLFVLPDFFVSDSVLSIIQKSECYISNTSFEKVRS